MTRRGVFVTGTDTGVGKTVAAACLVRAWGADYWKPVQTGLAEEAGDSATVAELAGLPPDRIIPPCYALQAPLSPAAAAALEGVAIDLSAFAVPEGDAPLVVEGAGGVLVPLTADSLIIDLMVRLGLPVVVVARSTLGTINHTLLTLEALRWRVLPVAGVILNGPPNPANRAAIEHYGRVRVLAELPARPGLDAGTVAELARHIPPLESL
jgi:malonyl-CoA O-methyltransferase